MAMLPFAVTAGLPMWLSNAIAAVMLPLGIAHSAGIGGLDALVGQAAQCHRLSIGQV